MRTFLIFLIVPAAAALAQEGPLSAFNKRAYGQVSSWILASADKMPEANYSFRPSDDVRSFGQIVGHVADAQFYFCSVMLGEKFQPRNIEKTKTAKADLVGALKEAGTYCGRAYDSMSDATGTAMVKFGAEEMPKLSLAGVNVAHLAEHYGNLVTYLRMKKIVPPSTEAMAAMQQQKK